MTELKATKACPYCHASISRTAEKCMACGEWVVERAGCGTFLVVFMLFAVGVFVVSEDACKMGKSVLDHVTQNLQERPTGKVGEDPASKSSQGRTRNALERPTGKVGEDPASKSSQGRTRNALERPTGKVGEDPATDWVALPCELRFASHTSAQHHGRLYKFSDVSVRYNKASLELELTFRYRYDGYFFPRVSVDLLDKNQVTLISGPFVRIAHDKLMASGLGAKLVSVSASNTLSWTFARMYYQDAVMAHVVINLE